jgi:hypothetical protein
MISFKPTQRYHSKQDYLLGGIILIKTRTGLIARMEIYKAVFASFHLLWHFIQVESIHFWASKAWIMDFSFSKKSLHSGFLSFNSQNIKGPEWYRQIPLSCLLCQYQIKKFCSPQRYLIHSFECQCQAPSPSHFTEAERICLRNRTQKLSHWMCFMFFFTIWR